MCSVFKRSFDAFVQNMSAARWEDGTLPDRSLSRVCVRFLALLVQCAGEINIGRGAKDHLQRRQQSTAISVGPPGDVIRCWF